MYFLSPFHVHSPSCRQGGGEGVREVSSSAVCEWTTEPLPLALLLSLYPFVWAMPLLPHISTLKQCTLFLKCFFPPPLPPSLSLCSLSCLLSLNPGPSVYSPPPPTTKPPSHPSKVSLSPPSLFLLSPAVLHSCSTSEGGGPGGRRGELELEGERERKRKRERGKGEGGPLYENAYCREDD